MQKYGRARTDRRALVWLLRGTELVGLLMLPYGLVASLWGIAAAGVGVILLSYAVYRRFIQAVPATESPSLGMGGGDFA